MSEVSDERREQMRKRALRHTDYPGEGFRIIQKAGKAYQGQDCDNAASERRPGEQGLGAISFDEALRIAKAEMQDVCWCIEYKTHWKFQRGTGPAVDGKYDDFIGAASICVLKESGDVLEKMGRKKFDVMLELDYEEAASFEC